MAFDESLAARIRTALARKKGVEEKKIFGGPCFMLNGHMLVGVWNDSMIVRLGEEQGRGCVARTARPKPFDINGKPMKGWVVVSPKASRVTTS